MIWRGMSLAGRSTVRTVRPQERDLAGYPLIGLPLGGAAVATGYHLLWHLPFDRISILLGIAAIAVIAMREWLTLVELRRYTSVLAEQHAKFQSLVAGANDMTVVLDESLRVRWQSAAAARQFGLSDHDVVGRPALSLVHADDAERLTDSLLAVVAGGDTATGKTANPIEVRIADGFGAWRDTEWTINGGRLTTSAGTVVVYIRDIGQRKELTRAVRRAATADQLTGLVNREALREAAGSAAQPAVLMVLGIGGLSTINDGYGPEIGDAVLVEAARRLRTSVSRADLPARLTGGRFAVLTGSGAVQAHLLATRLLTQLTEPYVLPGATASVTATAGLAEVPPRSDGGEGLRRAELALCGTQMRGVSTPVEWYDESMEAPLRRRLDIERELPGAIDRGELDLAYQPIVDLADNAAVGVEALLRWRHPKLGTVSPAELIPVAEEIGVMADIGQWVLHWACRQMSAWQRDDREVWMCVNVTGSQLIRDDFVPAVATALSTHLVPASRLVIEVAEPGLVTRGSDAAAATRLEAAVEHLSQLRTLGVRTAIDQFGSAPTALSQLRLLPLDLLKVDRQILTQPARRAGVAAAIIDVVVKLGQTIGVEVMAQGLESEADLEVAREAGCRYGQGFLIGRPMPSEHVEAFLDARRSLT
jgi:diguanylate cyclase (GGDEF)-like protein/PAS domain S-box-containing protein